MSRRGRPGEPGEPGAPGIGGGGAGGRGGRGGRGADLAHGWKRWKGLAGYIMIVLVAVIAIEIHHDQTTEGIKDFNRKACARSELLADNQAFVLKTLRTLLREEATEPDSDAHPLLDEQLDEILARLARVPRFECSEIRS